VALELLDQCSPRDAEEPRGTRTPPEFLACALGTSLAQSFSQMGRFVVIILWLLVVIVAFLLARAVMRRRRGIGVAATIVIALAGGSPGCGKSKRKAARTPATDAGAVEPATPTTIKSENYQITDHSTTIGAEPTPESK
jgi:hypothetical protein